MMEHIKKMADVISMGIEIGSSPDAIAKETYRAMMDAVPDLVWDSSGETQYSHSIFGFYVVWDGHYRTPEHPRAVKHNYPKLGANADHRAQVAAIWPDGGAS